MLYYFKDENGVLHCVAGQLPVEDQKKCRAMIEQSTTFRVKSAVLCLVADNPPVDAPMLA